MLLHLANQGKRLSVSSFTKSKEPKVVTSAIWKIWILVYSAPTKLIDGNDGEFANNNFKEMCEVMSIYLKLQQAHHLSARGQYIDKSLTHLQK